jgi:hypothetical protein
MAMSCFSNLLPIFRRAVRDRYPYSCVFPNFRMPDEQRHAASHNEKAGSPDFTSFSGLYRTRTEPNESL